jgi:hypothetical protein
MVDEWNKSQAEGIENSREVAENVKGIDFLTEDRPLPTV